MALFGFGKKKEEKVTGTCSCGGQCTIADIEKARIIVLGACCAKSSETFENVKTAAADLGITEEVVNIGDMPQIAKYGVMSTPAVVIDSKVVAMGKLVKVDEAKALLQKAGF